MFDVLTSYLQYDKTQHTTYVLFLGGFNCWEQIREVQNSELKGSKIFGNFIPKIMVINTTRTPKQLTNFKQVFFCSPWQQMTLFSLLFFLYILFYLSEILSVSCSWPLFCCKGMRKDVYSAAFFSECLPLAAVSAALSAGVRVRSCKHWARAAGASGSAQQPSLGTDK